MTQDQMRCGVGVNGTVPAHSVQASTVTAESYRCNAVVAIFGVALWLASAR